MEFLKTLGLEHAKTDHSVFIRRGDKPIYMRIHVDDPMFTGPDEREIIELEGTLHERFPFKLLGIIWEPLSNVTGRHGISLGQSHYIDAAIACA